jgi:predicted kinase
MKTLWVARGCPGSGKSFVVNKMAWELANKGIGFEICSSDKFFVCECCGKYQFNLEKLGYAHSWCRDKASSAMQKGVENVFIDNTNLTPKECKPYVQMGVMYGYEITFLDPSTPWAFDLDELEKRNQHGVPRHTLEKMLSRWVPEMTVGKVLGYDWVEVGGTPTNDEICSNQMEIAKQ